MILLVDNYDSFTYNLYQYILQAGSLVKVIRNDQLTIDDIKQLKPEKIVLSPGPGDPDGAGICLQIVEQLYSEIPILGICLGHQIIAQAFGAKVVKANQPMHGKTSLITHDQQTIYSDISEPFYVTRYHSLIVSEASMPACLEVTARTVDGEIMGLRHKKYPIEGVQFHPESILTEHGHELIQQFIQSTHKHYLLT